MPIAAGNGLGGGLYVAAGMVTLTSTTVSSNTAQGGNLGGAGYGGGVYFASGTATLRSDTITDNSSLGGTGGQGVGGGLYINTPATVWLDDFTVTNVRKNTASTSDPNIHGSYTRLH
jgi:hypothetical protein